MSKKNKASEAPETPDSVKAKLIELNKNRIDKCSAEINEVLEKYGCVLVASIISSVQGNSQNIQVVMK